MSTTSIVAVTEKMKMEIFLFIKQNNSITNRQCRELLGLGYDQVIYLFNQMIVSGDLIREGKTSSIKYKLPYQKGVNS